MNKHSLIATINHSSALEGITGLVLKIYFDVFGILTMIS